MWKLYYKESWALKNWCFWTVVLEKILESSLDCKENQSVHPKGNQSWIFTGRTDAEIPIFWPPDAKDWLLGKDPDAGKDWRQEEKDYRGWDGWMASSTRWVWVWASSGSCWWTGKRLSDSTELNYLIVCMYYNLLTSSHPFWVFRLFLHYCCY